MYCFQYEITSMCVPLSHIVKDEKCFNAVNIQMICFHMHFITYYNIAVLRNLSSVKKIKIME